MSPSPTCRFAIRDMPFRRSRCYGSLAIFSDLVPLLLRARRPKKIYCLPSAQKFPAQGTIAIINLQFTQKGKVLMFGSWIGSCPLLCTSGSSACPHDPQLLKKVTLGRAEQVRLIFPCSMMHVNPRFITDKSRIRGLQI